MFSSRLRALLPKVRRARLTSQYDWETIGTNPAIAILPVMGGVYQRLGAGATIEVNPLCEPACDLCSARLQVGIFADAKMPT